MSRTDLGSSIVLILFGAFVAFESWRMPRFESIGGQLHSAPGLVPGILGAVIVLLGTIMLVRYLLHREALSATATTAEAAATPGVADDQAANIQSPTSTASAAAAGDPISTATIDVIPEAAPDGTGAPPVANLPPPSNARMLWTLAFSAVFGIFMVGNLPFWLAVFAFVFVFIVWFERPTYKDARTTLTRVVIAGVIAGAAAFAVPFVFERIFLVNLP